MSQEAGAATKVPGRSRPGREGFTLIEVIIAILLLTVGILGMAATTGYMIRQVTLADLSTERAAARQSVIEEIRATPFADLDAGSRTVGSFSVAWQIAEATLRTRTLRVVTTGPGIGGTPPRIVPQVGDSVRVLVLRP